MRTKPYLTTFCVILLLVASAVFTCVFVSSPSSHAAGVQTSGAGYGSAHNCQSKSGITHAPRPNVILTQQQAYTTINAQIGVLIQRFAHRIKRPQDLPRRPLERLGQHGPDATRHGQAAYGHRFDRILECAVFQPVCRLSRIATADREHLSVVHHIIIRYTGKRAVWNMWYQPVLRTRFHQCEPGCESNFSHCRTLSTQFPG